MQTPIAPSPPATTTAPTTSAPSNAAPLPSGTGTVPNLPPGLAQALQNGGSITAQVTARPQAGQLTLTTQTGQTLQVQSALPAPTGTGLTVALQNLGPPATLLLQPHGQGQTQGTAQGQGQSALPQGQAATTGPIGSGPAVVTTLTQGSLLTATITATATGSTSATQAGSATTATATAQTNPATTQTTTATTSPQTAGAPQTAAPAQALPPGTVAQLRVLSLAPQGQPLSGGGTPGSFSAVVTGQGAGGSVTLQTPLGSMSITVPNPPPAGTQLLLTMVGDPRLPAPGSAMAQGSGPRYQALQEALTLLQGGNASAAQRLTQSLIPQPNAQFGLAALFFVTAMRNGGVDRWLGGDTARALSAAGGGKSGLLAKLEGDMGAAPARARDAAGQDWRVSTLPFLSDGQVDQIRLYIRDRGGQDAQDGDDAQPEAKRFVIEANFSRLGPLQLDGLTRDKHVDVMVRTQQALDPDAREDIRALFADTVTALGLTGRIDFSTVPKFDLFPDSDDNAPGPEGLTI